MVWLSGCRASRSMDLDVGFRDSELDNTVDDINPALPIIQNILLIPHSLGSLT